MAAIVLETSSATPIWAAYKSGEGVFDEMLDLARSERSGCQPTAKALFSMPPDWFAEISGRAQQMFRRMGVAFNVYVWRLGGFSDTAQFEELVRCSDVPPLTGVELARVEEVYRNNFNALA